MTVLRFFDRVDEVVLRTRGIDADCYMAVEYAAICNQSGKAEIIFYARPPNLSQNEHAIL